MTKDSKKKFGVPRKLEPKVVTDPDLKDFEKHSKSDLQPDKPIVQE